MSGEFVGFPVAALDFFDDLGADNSKVFWEAHRRTWDDDVRGPMQALVRELEPEFGAGKLFRPYRDLRFAKDKTRPYKEQVAAFVVEPGRAAGYYVQLASAGLLVGAGAYGLSRDQILRMRTAVDDERRGGELARHVRSAAKKGLELRTEDALKRVPREYDAEHPRGNLLRLRSVTLGRSTPPTQAWLHTRAALTHVRDAWRASEPLCRWLDEHVGAPDLVPA